MWNTPFSVFKYLKVETALIKENPITLRYLTFADTCRKQNNEPEKLKVADR